MFSVQAVLILLAVLAANSPVAEQNKPPPGVLPCAEPPAGMACIPGGLFLRGADKGPRNSRPQEQVWLQTFYMDKYEVTVEEYELCVGKGKCVRAKTNYRDYSRPKQPKVGVNWFQAVAFCQALGKHLPSEAQWEKSARGSDGRLYPWGKQKANCKLAVIKDRRGRSCGVRKKFGHPDKGRTLEVGSRPAAIYGLHDMAGNSWEWVYDWYSRSYKHCGQNCRGIDPKGPCAGKSPCPGHDQRIVRGGSWYWPAHRATTIHRRPHYPKNRPYHHFGFRCAASLDEVSRMNQSK